MHGTSVQHQESESGDHHQIILTESNNQMEFDHSSSKDDQNIIRLDEMLLSEEGNNNPMMNYDSDNDEVFTQAKPDEPFEELLNEDCQEVLLPGNDDILKDSDEAHDQEEYWENKKKGNKSLLDKMNIAIKEEFGKDPRK